MTKAAAEYQAICKLLGIREEAMRLDKLGKAIQQGWTSSVELAVDELGGGLNPKEIVTQSLKKELMDAGKDLAKDSAIELGKAEVKKPRSEQRGLGAGGATRLALAHAPGLEQHVDIPEHLAQREVGLGDGDVAPQRLRDLVGGGRLGLDRPAILFARRSCSAKRSSISFTWFH